MLCIHNHVCYTCGKMKIKIVFFFLFSTKQICFVVYFPLNKFSRSKFNMLEPIQTERNVYNINKQTIKGCIRR